MSACQRLDFGLTDFLCLDMGGRYVPGRMGGNPMLCATYLEWLRRGGEGREESARYRSWLAENADTEWLISVMTVAARLEELTRAGADDQGFSDYLGPMLDPL